MAHIHPVILCGGSGTRLWPLSRKSYPKQFSPLLGEESLFQASVRRLTGPDYAAPLVLTNADFRFIVAEQLAQIKSQAAGILIEPEARDTAPAILAAALWLDAQTPDALMLVAPSDHVIPDVARFCRAVEGGAAMAEAGALVTFGIKPDRPETGYGYLELSETGDEPDQMAHTLRRFVEKPDNSRAEKMLAAGNYLWNAGIFLFSVKTILAAFKTHAPDLLAPVSAALKEAVPDLGFMRLAAAPWAKAPRISIDYAVMEKSDNLSVVPYDGTWSDLGGWDAVWRQSPSDDDGVACHGAATAIDCQDSLLRSESEGQKIVGLGLKDVIAIAMPDA
ncbi:MAG: mannose-1-phosphate guanylyltransferase, partial [Halocynthiibacter sp.]